MALAEEAGFRGHSRACHTQVNTTHLAPVLAPEPEILLCAQAFFWFSMYRLMTAEGAPPTVATK